MNSQVLAYLGDAYYEVLVRKFLISKGIAKVNELQSESLKFCSAKSQARILEELLQYLNEEESDVVYRARNNKRKHHPKNTDIITYKHSTAFEALFGYLYLNNNFERIDELFLKIVNL